MTFESILFIKTGESTNEVSSKAPAFFVDLNLNQIIDTITADRDIYDLQPFFYTPLYSEDAIQYRHEIMQEFANETLMASIKSFAEKMVLICWHLALSEKLIYKNFKEGWFLEAAMLYCETINNLVNGLSMLDLKSRGFLSFREYLTNYAKSDVFTSLLTATQKLNTDLSTVKYNLHINGLTVRVRKPTRMPAKGEAESISEFVSSLSSSSWAGSKRWASSTMSTTRRCRSAASAANRSAACTMSSAFKYLGSAPSDLTIVT